MIYLDNAATTFPKPDEVYAEMDRINRTLAVNAGRGSYTLARQASLLIESTRQNLRRLLGLNKNEEVILTPSVTVALNQVIHGLDLGKGDIVYVSPYEHNAVARTLHSLMLSKGIVIEELGLDEKSLEIDLDKIRYQFSRRQPSAVFCTHVSNVTGYLLPIEQIFSESKKYGAVNVLDTAQSLGLIPLNASDSDIDILAFAGHKTLYGPFGVGGFININNIPLSVTITGGTGSGSLNLNMPESGTAKFEAASPNITAIGGLNKALEVLDTGANYEHEKMLTDYLLGKIRNNNKIKLYLPADSEKHVGIVSFNIEGFKADDVGMILDEDFDIAVRCGYHCAPYIHKYLKDETNSGTVRVGLGRFNSKENVDRLVEAVEEIMEG